MELARHRATKSLFWLAFGACGIAAMVGFTVAMLHAGTFPQGDDFRRPLAAGLAMIGGLSLGSGLYGMRRALDVPVVAEGPLLVLCPLTVFQAIRGVRPTPAPASALQLVAFRRLKDHDIPWPPGVLHFDARVRVEGGTTFAVRTGPRFKSVKNLLALLDSNGGLDKWPAARTALSWWDEEARAFRAPRSEPSIRAA
jgi:hypothetical protein